MYVARFALRKATLLMLIITREKKGKKKITYKKKYKEEMTDFRRKESYVTRMKKEIDKIIE